MTQGPMTQATKMQGRPARLTALVSALALLGLSASALHCNDEDERTAATGSPTTTAAATTPAPTATATATSSEGGSGQGGTAEGSKASGEGGGGEGGTGGQRPDSPPPMSGSAPPPAPAPAPPPKPEPAAPPPPKPAPPPPAPEPTAQPAPPPSPKPVQVAPAKEGTADAVAQRIDDIFKPVKHFRARFDQKYTAKIHGKSKTSKGVLYVKRPGKLSLSYHDPNKNRAVSDGTTLKVYEHENKQMFVKDVKNTEYPGAFSFILGKGLRSSFDFEFHKTSKWEGGPVIIGTPRVPNPGYKTVLFYIDESLLKKGDLGAVRRVLVVDAQGNRNRFDFIHASEPTKIEADEFEFTPPPGTEIIKG